MIESGENFSAVQPSAGGFLHRLYQSAGGGIGFQACLLYTSYFPGALEIDFSKASLYEFMGQMGRAPVAFKDSVQAVAACPKLAKLLELSPGQIVFQCDYLSYDKDNCLVEQNRSFFRPDKMCIRDRSYPDVSEGIYG